MSLIYETKRPINKSTPIVTFSKYCGTIYFFGLLANVWVNTFLLNYVEKYYTFLYNLAPIPLTKETSFMLRIVATAFFMTILGVLGLIVNKLATALSVQTLFSTYFSIKNDRETNIKAIYKMSRDLSLNRTKYWKSNL